MALVATVFRVGGRPGGRSAAARDPRDLAIAAGVRVLDPARCGKLGDQRTRAVLERGPGLDSARGSHLQARELGDQAGLLNRADLQAQAPQVPLYDARAILVRRRGPGRSCGRGGQRDQGRGDRCGDGPA